MNQRDEQVITHIYFHCKDIQEFIERFGDSFEAFCEADQRVVQRII